MVVVMIAAVYWKPCWSEKVHIESAPRPEGEESLRPLRLQTDHWTCEHTLVSR